MSSLTGIFRNLGKIISKFLSIAASACTVYCSYCFILHLFCIYLFCVYFYIQSTSQTFTMSNFLFGPFNILINFSYKSVWYLELCYLKLSLCRTIFSVPSVIFGLFPFPSAISNIRMRFTNESYCSFQAFEC